MYLPARGSPGLVSTAASSHVARPARDAIAANSTSAASPTRRASAASAATCTVRITGMASERESTPSGSCAAWSAKFFAMAAKLSSGDAR